MLCVYGGGLMPAGGQGQVLASTMPRAQEQEVQLNYEDDPLCPSGYILLIYSMITTKEEGETKSIIS